MTCTEYQKSVAGFIDGEAEAVMQADLFRHLGECTECRSFLESMMRVRNARRKETIPFPSYLDESVLSATVSQHTGRVVRFRVRRDTGFWARRFEITAPLASAAAIGIILLGLVAGALFVHRTEQPAGTPVNPALQAQPVTVIMLYTMPPVEVHGSRISQAIRDGQFFQN